MTKRKVKHVSRGRLLTRQEADQYNKIREQIEAEKPSIQARFRSAVAINEAFAELKRIRELQGKSLATMNRLTGMDRSAISKLETGVRSNFSIDILMRYASALGKRITVNIVDDSKPS